jgi:hypothetical protein
MMVTALMAGLLQLRKPQTAAKVLLSRAKVIYPKPAIPLAAGIPALTQQEHFTQRGLH